jgi:hypothetical protein
LAALLLRYNASVVPFWEQQISIYVRPGVFLALRTGLGDFINNQFSNPVSRRAPMPAAFLMAVDVRRRAINWNDSWTKKIRDQLGRSTYISARSCAPGIS